MPKARPILIFGLGSYPGGSGSSAALYLARQGHNVVVTDLKTADKLHQPTICKLLQFTNVELVLGKHRKQDIKRAQYIVRNPGVPDNEYIQYARQLGKPITNDVGIFLNELRRQWCRQQVAVVGITGTRGKSTTTSLITAVLRAQFGVSRVHCGGNIGTSPLNFLRKIKAGHIVVLELSSWLLRDLHEPKFTVAVVTNLLPDHMNYYKTMRAYQADKELIFSGQTGQEFAVLNQTNPVTQQMVHRTKAHVIWFGPKKISGVQLLGEHNQYNIGAAWEVGKIFQVPIQIAERAIRAFTGVPNRLEKIRTYRGRTFYNDTTATTPDATIAALRSFPKKVILISGGNSKQLSLRQLAQEIHQRVKSLILLPGNANHALPPGVTASDMKTAVQLAWQASRPGDVIVLSPGLTWLPVMNEFERGRRFVNFVRRLR